MDEDDALNQLEDAEVVPCLAAPINEAKELLNACLDDGIPALLDRAPRCHDGGCGCAPKLELLVRPDDLPRVQQLMARRWHGMLEREGTEYPAGGALAPDDEPPCPACGVAAPLQEGACSGCGLHLA